MDQKLQTLKDRIRDYGSLLVAYSGGVDSGLLAVVARQVLGEKTRCLLLASPLVPRTEIEEAVATAEHYGLDCTVFPFPIFEDPRFRGNPRDRCYHCRRRASAVLKEKAHEWGISAVADGANLSDLTEYRPGLIAADEAGIVHPFIEAGIGKDDIRAIARDLGLHFWAKPSQACLASRIPYGEEITTDRLLQIESAETILRSWGFPAVRVRTYRSMARIEVARDDLERIFARREDIVRELKNLGFSSISLDLEGYRTGSMDL
ncbi:MAG: ATP-dependent sacrificial sulfur transferase LarE [Methanomicrobiales archaeon]|nr:ATP-dependent sacrificial sulfur transferase LarE [Methanomicrobiales archaeon]